MNSQLPQVIFLDAAGTLFGVRGSVGKQYEKIARQFGVDADARILERAFFRSFTEAPPMAFPGTPISEIPNKEFAWWQAVTKNTFAAANYFHELTDFSEFFQELYHYFSTPAPWEVYPDVIPTLKSWQAQGIELGVLSNFDTRLYDVLDALNLASFFTSVTLSTEVGAAKPDPQIFTHALRKYPYPPSATLHIGDSVKADYQGAKQVGCRAIWLNRSDELPPNTIPDFEHYNSLNHIKLTV